MIITELMKYGSTMAAKRSLEICVLLVLSTSVFSTPRKPNIVILLADDLGIGDVGCFGNTTLRTPHIDKLAEDGVKFTQHLSAAAVCTPSRAAFLTGRYPLRMGMVPTGIVRVNMFLSSTSGIPENETTFAQIAQEEGYKTGFIGKWHLGLSCGHIYAHDFCHHPLQKGFDYYFGLPLTNLKDFGNEGDGVFIAYFGQNMDMYLAGFILGGLFFLFFLYKMKYFSGWMLFLTANLLLFPTTLFCFIAKQQHVLNGVIMRNYDVIEQPVDLYSNLAAKLVQEGENFIASRHEDGEPFLLFMSWIQVHTALHASRRFKHKSRHGTYGDEVEELDWSVGQIIQALENYGFANDTLVYFSSDNGGHVEEHNLHGAREGGYNGIYRGGKAQGGMEGGIRVPTVAKWPGVISPNTVISHATSQMDMFTTMLSIWDRTLPTDRAIDGKNILPLLSGADRKPPHEFLFHYCGPQIHAARYIPPDGTGSDVFKVHYATPNWQPGTEGCGYICNCFKATWHDPPLLFNIAKDPSEKHPLTLEAPEHMAIVDLLTEAVQRHRETVLHAPDQFSASYMWPRPWLQPCCNFPLCQCSED